MEYDFDGSEILTGTGTTVASPGTWASLGCIVSITPNTITVAFRDLRPCINSTSKKIRKKPSTTDYGTMGGTFQFTTERYQTLLDAAEAHTRLLVGLVLGDTGKAIAAMCYVNTIGIPVINDQTDAITVDVTFMIDDEFDLIAKPTIGGGGGGGGG